MPGSGALGFFKCAVNLIINFWIRKPAGYRTHSRKKKYVWRSQSGQAAQNLSPARRLVWELGICSAYPIERGLGHVP